MSVFANKKSQTDGVREGRQGDGQKEPDGFGRKWKSRGAGSRLPSPFCFVRKGVARSCSRLFQHLGCKYEITVEFGARNTSRCPVGL